MYRTLQPLLFSLDPERAHQLAIRGLRLAPAQPKPADPRLGSTVAGLAFPNPVGLAAGFDKDALVPDALLARGFGFVEVGTLTPLPQAGNPRPRLFRLVEDGAVINRMGFNNGGQAAAHVRLSRRRRGTDIVGVNIGANKDSADRIGDYAAGIARMADVADYLTVNISSPNTPGLRALQDPAALAELLSAVAGARRAGGPPVFLKVAPDLDPSDVEVIVEAAITGGMDALIVANTTVSRPPLRSAQAGETGGLSGRPLAPLALAMLRRFAAAAAGRIPLISAGGIATADDAWDRLAAGASLVQLYSALVYEGPGLARRIAAGLAARMEREGVARIADLVGAGATSTRPSRLGS
ncbi:dihydroorotate dehydrogenase [Sphingomonas jejuensis]|uniref:Dihydroorotate dehydrogenase (quinone) n=1 Tax=Sphingomonas jejuensis TaxID=904715 RepID=A0ABX0XNT6_9SPHN|nr:quinone-dependent dihydroorotate dehydrogenase [Sphingomonas jejuensis]NJC35052.1 dihydroorotate dehydrogenase [Sphingomonas jejuensis]